MQQQRRGAPWRWSETLSAVLALGAFGVLGTVLGGVVPLAAQVTYMVFPVQKVVSNRATGQPTGQKVTVEAKDSTVKFLVDEIARQAHLLPTYVHSAAFDRRISVQLHDLAAMDAFAVVLKGTGLVARLASDGETVMIRPNVQGGGVWHEFAGSISGSVTDSASGQGLGGAAVLVEGTKLSTVTSDSGHFTLRNVPVGDQVVSVKLFGYKPAQRTVTMVDSQRTMVRFVLVPVPTVLSGVVTTATGLQRKVEVGNDITTLNVDSIQRVAPVMSVTDLLETRVPGLTVMHTDGVPGDPSRLRLRGTGSIQLNNDPIIIIDGVRVYSQQSDPRTNNLAKTPTAAIGNGLPAANTASGSFAAPSPLDQIDPSSIESIEVLKGPSATAVYGSDAANGVIIITTKHGRAGPTHWDMALADGINYLPGKWPMNYYLYGKPIDAQGPVIIPSFCQWYDVTCRVDSVVGFQALNDPNLTLMSQGHDRNTSLNVSGGDPIMQYSATGSTSGTLGYLKLPGIEQQRYQQFYGSPVPGALLRPDNLNTWGLDGTVTVLPSHTMRVVFESRYYSSTQQQSTLQSALLTLASTPIDTAVLGTAPLITNEFDQAMDNQVTTQSTVSLHWQLTPWLPLDGTAGIATNQRTDQNYIPFGIAMGGPGCTGFGFGGSGCSNDTSGYFGIGRGTTHNQTVNVGTTIPLSSLHMMLDLGGNAFIQSTADLSTYTNQLSPGVTIPTSFICNLNTVSNCPTAQATSGQTTYGWYVQPRLTFNSRFFVTPGFRLDGGSGGTHASYGAGGANTGGTTVGGLSAFPKIDLSYVMVDRQNDRPLWGVLTLLRPRLAFGIAGVQPGPADKLRLYNVGLANYTLNPLPNDPLIYGGACSPPLISLDGSNTVPAVCLDALGNTQLRPEQSQELEGGFDVTLWQGRATLTYTQANKTDHDAILSVPIAPSVYGAGSLNYEKNIGVIRNTSTEITANAFLIQNRAISWNVGMNLTNANNLVVRLNKGQLPIVLDQGNGGLQERVTPGYPLFGVWAHPIVSFSDVNHDGVIEPNEIVYADSAVYLGQPNPKYQFNLTTNLSLLNGRLSVNATFAYTNGLLQTNAGACNDGTFTLLPDKPGTSLSTEAAVVAAGCGDALQRFFFQEGISASGIGLAQVVNTFRFNDLSINYQIPRAISSWFRIPRMSIALQGSNLALHTNYRGMDPDVNAFSTVSAGDETVDLGQIPEPRMWWLRMTLGN